MTLKCPQQPNKPRLSRILVWPLFIALIGCRSLDPLPPVNLQEPGWTVREGQAVWNLPPPKPEIAGELIVATRGQDSFVQFSKAPFALATGRATEGRWEIKFPPENKRYAGPGDPPARLVWLQLARALAGQPLARGWTWQTDSNGWRLANSSLNESLEGFFNTAQ